MTISYISSTTTVYSTGNPDPGTTPTHNVGDMLILTVGTKPDTTPATAPSGWTLMGATAGGTGTTGIDTGPMRIGIFYREADGTSLDNTGAITVTGNNVSAAQVHVFRKTGTSWDFAYVGAADTATGSPHSATMPSNPGLTVGDMLFAVGVIPTDVTTPAQFSAETVAATGMTTVNLTELTEWDTSSGQDMGGWLAYGTVVTGTASAAPTVSATAGGTTTNVAGPIALVRLREVSPVPKSGSDTASVAIADSSSKLAGTFRKPQLIDYHTTGFANTTSPQSVTFFARAGETLLLMAAAKDSSKDPGSPSGGTGLTWTTITPLSNTGAWYNHAIYSTVVPSDQEITLSIATSGGTTEPWGFVVMRWNDTGGFGDTGTTTQNGSAPNLSINVLGRSNSAIAMLVNDYLGADGSARQYRTINSVLPVELHYNFNSTVGTDYVAYWEDVASAGTKTTGLVAPSTTTKTRTSSVEVRSTFIDETVVSKSASDTASIAISDSGSVTPLTTIQYVNSTSTGNASQSSSRNAAVPSGAQAGDVALIFFDTFQMSAATTITGFTKIGDTTVGGSDRTQIFWKRLTGADTGTYAIAWGGTTAWNNATVVLYRNVKTSGDPHSDVDQATGTGTLQPSVTSTPTVANAMLAFHSYNANPASLHTPPTSQGGGWTEITDQDCYTDSYKLVSTAQGYTVSGGGDDGGASNRVTSVVALAPDEGAAATPISGSDTSSVAISDSSAFSISVAGSDTASVAIAETATIAKTSSTSDTASLAIADASAVAVQVTGSDTSSVSIADASATSITVTASDTTALSITESQTSNSTVNGTDTASISIAESQTSTSTLSGSDTAALSIADSSALTKQIAATDTASLSIADASSLTILNILSGSDTGAVSIAETASVSGTVSASDTSAVSIVDTSVVGITLSRTDTSSVAIADTSTLLVTVSTSDTSSLAITESSAVANTQSASDTSSVAITETAQVAKFSSTSDTGSLVITETSSVSGTTVGSDTSALTITDAAVVGITLSASDTSSVAISESSVFASAVTASDTASVAINDQSSIGSTLPGQDTSSVAITDTASISGTVSTSDTAALTISETTQMVQTRFVTASDTSTLSINDVSAIAKTVTASDTGSVTITETSSVAVFLSRTDTATLTITEGIPTITASLTASDVTGVTISETVTLTVFTVGTDTSGITITEGRVISNALSSSDTLTIGFIDSGVRTEKTTELYVRTNGGWYPGRPYMYINGEWKEITFNVYKNGSWL